MRRKKIGTMDFHGSVDVTDPCYDKNVWCRINDIHIKEGEYTCMVWYHTDKYVTDGETCTYKHIGIIGIYLNGTIPPQQYMQYIDDIGVDSGMAGFFHDKPDYNSDEWIKFCNSTTCDNISNKDAWIIDNGFCSLSGDGDGAYPVYAYKNGEEITALEIKFM